MTGVPASALKMNLWLLLTFSVLARCAQSCPYQCSCSLIPSGTGVECINSPLTHFPAEGLPSNTTTLLIKSCNLTSIIADHLRAVPLLEDLQLHHNNLTSLPEDLLKYVPHLKGLDLTGNQLVSLPPNIFSHVPLRFLVLRNNLLEKADAEWFSGNSSLMLLDLSGNRLTGVPTAMLQKLPNLMSLDLSENNLEDLQPDALQDLHQLQVLDLTGNKFSSLRPTMFTHNLNLSQLYLQENQLKELPATLLKGLQRLELLLLDQNQLQHLPSELLAERKSSFGMILRGNPWVCDENIVYLWKWLADHPLSVLHLDEVTCAAPDALKHRKLVSLTDSELGLNNSSRGTV